MPDKTIVLICNGCLNVWLDPRSIKWEGVVQSKKELEEKFNMDFLSPFEDERGYWSTKEEAKKSEWRNLMKTNELFLIKRHR
jgi:hypothetical protein